VSEDSMAAGYGEIRSVRKDENRNDVRDSHADV
jgi:hypothetical protein